MLEKSLLTWLEILIKIRFVFQDLNTSLQFHKFMRIEKELV